MPVVFVLNIAGNFRFASLQSKVGQSLLLASGKAYNDISRIVLVEAESISKSGKVKTKAYFKSDAVLRIVTRLDMPVMKLAGKVGPMVPAFFRNIAYNVVAENRYRFGEADQCRLWDDNFDDRFIADPED
jgi:predicted DCC family thiol-disulfide oxidoreductase YuxK